MDKIIDYLEEYSDDPIEQQVQAQNKLFLERLRAGQVNYEWTIPGTKNHEDEKALVEQLTKERSVKRDVERRKHHEKVTEDRRGGDDRRKNVFRKMFGRFFEKPSV